MDAFDEAARAYEIADYEMKKKFILFMTGQENVDADPEAIPLKEAKLMEARFAEELIRLGTETEVNQDVTKYVRTLRDGAREFISQQEQIARDYEAFVRGDVETEEDEEETDNDTP